MGNIQNVTNETLEPQQKTILVLNVMNVVNLMNVTSRLRDKKIVFKKNTSKCCECECERLEFQQKMRGTDHLGQGHRPQAVVCAPNFFCRYFMQLQATFCSSSAIVDQIFVPNTLQILTVQHSQMITLENQLSKMCKDRILCIYRSTVKDLSSNRNLGLTNRVGPQTWSRSCRNFLASSGNFEQLCFFPIC